MNSSAQAAIDTASDQRRELARHVANLFFAAERDGLEAAQQNEFGEIFIRLLDNLALDTKVRLSERLSRSEDAFVPLIRQLTHETAAVAGPVLEHSPLLTEEDLVAASENMTTEHRLAVSRREAGLTTRVTDSLVRFGETQVLRSVTENKAAQISDNGFMTIAGHALDDEQLMARLAARVDMPAQCAVKILPRLKGEVRERLMALAADKSGALEALVVQARAEEAGHKLSARQQKVQAKALAQSIADGTRTLEEVAMMLATERRPHALAVVLSARSMLPESRCADALFEVNGDLLKLLCSALDLSAAAYRECDAMRRDALHLPSGDAAKLAAAYATVDPAEARRTLRLANVMMTVR